MLSTPAFGCTIQQISCHAILTPRHGCGLSLVGPVRCLDGVRTVVTGSRVERYVGRVENVGFHAVFPGVDARHPSSLEQTDDTECSDCE